MLLCQIGETAKKQKKSLMRMRKCESKQQILSVFNVIYFSRLGKFE
jgi:hypothetical protein